MCTRRKTTLFILCLLFRRLSLIKRFKGVWDLYFVHKCERCVHISADFPFVLVFSALKLLQWVSFATLVWCSCLLTTWHHPPCCRIYCSVFIVILYQCSLLFPCVDRMQTFSWGTVKHPSICSSTRATFWMNGSIHTVQVTLRLQN